MHRIEGKERVHGEVEEDVKELHKLILLSRRYDIYYLEQNFHRFAFRFAQKKKPSTNDENDLRLYFIKLSISLLM